MIKKYVALCLALVCTMALGGYSAGAQGYNIGSMAQVLGSLNVMHGDPDGNLRLQDNVTRGEFTKMAVAISPVRNSVSVALKTSPFKDVSYKHWAAPYIYVGVKNGYLRGYSDFSFRPDNHVTFAEATNITLKLLGYTDSDFTAMWPYGQMSTAENIGLTDGISGDYNSPISREGCVILLNNLLNTKQKNSSAKYASVIDCQVMESIVMVATKDEDSSVPAGKVFTTAGTYKISDSVNKSYIGSRGDAIIKNGDEIISFIPTENTLATKMVAYSALDNLVIGYVDGVLTQENIAPNTTAYVGSTATTFSAARQRISMGSILTMQKDALGNVEYVCIAEGSQMQGPVIVNSGAWYNGYAQSLDGYAVIRNGSKSSAAELKVNDVVYFARDLKTIFAYSNTKTGIYESAYPNKDMPSSVKVSGVTYEIEGADAFNALSSAGNIDFGDTVTLLLGKDGKIAGISTSGEATVYGYLIGSGQKNHTDENGNIYNSHYATVVAPSGEEVQYVTRKSYSAYKNSIVKVSLSDGYGVVSTVKMQNTLSGTVDADAKKLGNVKLADNVNILDVASVSAGDSSLYKKVFLKRLDGVNLSQSDILYFTKNSYGEVDNIILKDVTGDLYSYGVVTEKSGASYTYDVGGNSYIATGNYTAVSKGEGTLFAFGSMAPGTGLDYMKSLHKISAKIENISSYQVETANNIYTLSDTLAVYRVTPGIKGYHLMTLEALIENYDNYSVHIYYDKKDKDGGRVRVIIATEK